MSRVLGSIVKIVKPIAEKRGVKFSSFSEGELRSIGRMIDAKRMTVDAALTDINKECDYSLERQDLRDIEKALSKLAR